MKYEKQIGEMKDSMKQQADQIVTLKHTLDDKEALINDLEVSLRAVTSFALFFWIIRLVKFMKVFLVTHTDIIWWYVKREK